MDMYKYEQVRNGIIDALANKDNLTHSEMLQELKRYLSLNHTSFVGSVECHME